MIMPSEQPEPSLSQPLTERFEGMTSKQLMHYLASLEERVSAMEETLDLSSENMSETIQ